MTPSSLSLAPTHVGDLRSPGPNTQVRTAERLGDVLVDHGVITLEQLAEALVRHRQVGEPLGAVLLAGGLVTRRQLYVALAQVWDADLVFVDPLEVDPDLARLFEYPMLAREVWMPLRIERTEAGELQVVVATAGRPGMHISRAVTERTGIRLVRQLVTTDWDVQRALRTVWRDEVVHEAVGSLAERRPEESASRVFVWQQIAVLVGLATILLVCAAVWFSATMLVLVATVNVAVALAAGTKALISTIGTAYETVEQVSGAEVAALDDAELPSYTILVPVYKEAGIVGLLMRNLAALDYPREKLEILLLLEEDDPETLAAALDAAPPDLVRIIVVPHSLPKTKPRACNVGLAFARGAFVVIYDAEDRPDPDQLKKALVAFRKGGDDLVCVQAALNYFNARENLLTRMFTLEYSSWFDYTLAGLDKLRLPIPLGGTSNHFRTDLLRQLGGWDPYNVTEDADLSIRASARGYRVAVVNSTTYEEANMAVGNWIRQRSRWIKGYMQTVLVHTRHPVRLVRSVGLRQTAGFALLIGGTPLMFLATPWLYALFVMELIWPGGLLPTLPDELVLVCTANLLLGNGVIIYLSLLAGFKRRNYGLVGLALLSPLYWLLHSIASYKAAWQLIAKPFYWEKTQHGLSSHTRPNDPLDIGAAPASAASDGPGARTARGQEDGADGLRSGGRPARPAPGPTQASAAPVQWAVTTRPVTTARDVAPTARPLVAPPASPPPLRPVRIRLQLVVLICAVLIAVEWAVVWAVSDSLMPALYAACATVMVVFAASFCLEAVTVSGFAAGCGAAGLTALEPSWLLPLLGGTALLAVVCGLAPRWAQVDNWHKQSTPGTAAQDTAAEITAGREHAVWQLAANWRTDRVGAAFLVVMYPPMAAAGAVWFMEWMTHR